MRRKIIAGNWKLNNIVRDSLVLVEGLKPELTLVNDVEIVVCPVYTALESVGKALENSNIKLGAQDMYWEDQGAFTGEVSGMMLKDIGCKYVIIGHSERRQYFNETNERVNKKVKAALKWEIKPIMCVGETLEQREEGSTFDVIKDHVENGIAGLADKEMLDVVIAYEPVWAIGTGKNATPEQAQEVHAYIRDLLKKQYGSAVSEEIIIQYGGSVKPENAAELMAQNDIDGALVGGASLKVDSFTKIVKAASAREV